MNLKIKVYYRIELLPVVCAFVAETARVFGASEQEITKLNLASEEAMMHILETFPPDNLDDQFEVTCLGREDGVEYIFTNMGLPVNPEALPQYDIDAPDETVIGLRLYLLRQMVDRLDFVNLGNEGWRTVFFKRLESFSSLLPVAKKEEETSRPRGKIAVCRGQADDAHDIIELAYYTYRYSYIKKSFYYADLLKSELTSGRIISMLARNDDGKAIGHIALIMDSRCADIAEVGALMIMPEYRRSTCLLQLLKYIIHFSESGESNLSIYTVNLVTTHTLSQQLCQKFQFKPMALNLSVHERAKFIEIESESKQRESTLYAIRLTKPLPKAQMIVPKMHLEITKRLFENAGIEMEFDTECASYRATSSSIREERSPKTQSAQLEVLAYGQDFYQALKHRIYELSLDQTATITLLIPTWQPVPEEIDSELNALGFFFTGYVHATTELWYLHYTALINQKFEFEDVKVHDPVAVELKEYIQKGYEKAIP